MSEVAIVAAITGGTSVLTSAITAAVTYSVSKNSASVELAKVTAENERLREANREDERRNRQSTYHEFIDAATAIVQILGFEATVEKRREICNHYNHLLSGVLVFSPPSVRSGAIELNAVYRRIWPALREQMDNHPEKTQEESWRDATLDLREEFRDRGSELIELMHRDVTRGITFDDSP